MEHMENLPNNFAQDNSEMIHHRQDRDQHSCRNTADTFCKLTEDNFLSLFDNNSEILSYFLDLRKVLVECGGQGERCLCDPRDSRMKARLDYLQWEPRVTLKADGSSASHQENGCGLASKQTALDSHGEEEDSWQNRKEALDDIDNNGCGGSLSGSESNSFVCGVSGCLQTFTSLASYESHYHSNHNFVCAECKRKFVSNFLLDIHVEENHDSYFQLLSPRMDMYRCLVESCELKFRTPELRKDHLVTEHKFPASFSFHRPIKERSQKSEDKSYKSSVKQRIMDKDSETTLSSILPHSPASSPSLHRTAATTATASVEVEMAEAGDLDRENERARGNKRVKAGRGRGQKLPPVICFGRGSQRAFQHRGRGGRGRHWHQVHSMDVDTKMDIEKVDLTDLKDSLRDGL